MRKLLCLTLFLITWQVFAQVNVTGKVVMGESQEPIAFAEVSSVENPEESTFTDEDGNFSLTLSQDKGSLNVLTMDGVVSVTPYQGNQNLTIALDPTKFKLSDVVAIGYGSVDKADLTTAVSYINNTEQIDSRPITSVADFLQGQAAGVVVTQEGDPSQLPQVDIRGIGSINQEAVLYVVDGMPYYGPAINPNDIKSISVLKDAAAAAIYGAQASAGVVIIETKKGTKGKPQIGVNFFTGFQEVNNLPTPLTAEQRNSVYNQAFANDGVDGPDAYNATANPWGAVTRTNWIDEIFRTGAIQGVNTDFSGASENVNYYASLEYLNKEGVLLGTDFERYAARGKFDVDITDNIKTGINLYYAHSEAKGTNTNSGYSGTIINALYMPSSAPVYDENGNFHGTVPFELADQFAGAYGDVYNPVALLLRPTTTSPTNNVNAQGYLSYEPIKNLTFKTSFGYNYIHKHYKKFIPRIPEVGRSNDENFLNEAFTTKNNWVWDNQINYNLSLNKHNFDFTVVHSALENKYDWFYQQGKNFDIESSNYQFMEFADEVFTTKNDRYKVRMTSAIGRIMYDYAKRYYLSASIRRDETSKTNPEGDYQVGWFPSVSGAWRIAKEPFYDSEVLSDLKIRGSWGQLGNVEPLNPYAFTNRLRGGRVVMGEDGALGDYGFWASDRPSVDVSWETVESFDVGLDFELFRKLTGTFDYYNKITRDMIIIGESDDHWGVGAPYINGGELQNKGFELTLNYQDRIDELDYSIGFNFAKNNNELTSLEGYSSESISYNNQNVRSQLYPFRSQVGQEVYSYYLIPYEGIFQSQEEINNHSLNGELIQPDAQPGDFKFRDTNGDGKIDDDDRVFYGSYSPDFTYAFNIKAGFKNFDLSAMFQGVYGVEVFNAYKYSAYNTGNGFNLDNGVLNAWTTQNTGTDIPRLTVADTNLNLDTNSSWYLEDGSYLRLKNITLGYNFGRFINTFDEARIYLNAENVFTITDYSGIDPEVGGIGLDNAKYPVARTFTIGAQFKF